MIIPQDIYNPLYTNKDKFIILITGGRGSGKSFNVSTFIERLTFEIGHIILYCRYTMTAANISIIPEVNEKIEMDCVDKYFNVTKQDIINLRTGSKILFRGIKTSSGNQTAKLKSIQGVTTLVCDEAEEWTSEIDFDKIRLSIRQKGIQNRIIIIMNPTDVNHFVYQKYIKNTHKIEYYDGVPVQISTHPQVLHIHTTYLDNLDNLGTEFLRDAEEEKANNSKKYGEVFMGRWASISEGSVFKNWNIVNEIPDFVKKRGLGQDFGYTNDPSATIDCAIHDNDLYLDELCYHTRMLTGDIIDVLKPIKMKVMSESADPRLIQEVANAGILIYPVEKFQGSVLAGIQKMQEYNIKITKRSYNLINEFRNYVWDKDKDGNYINQPVDKFNHGIDAARYWILGEILGRISGFKEVETIDSINDSEIAGNALYITPSIDNYFICISAYRFGKKILIKDILYNKDGVINKDKVTSMLKPSTYCIFESEKEWFNFANEIREEANSVDNMRVYKMRLKDEALISSSMELIRDKIVFIKNEDYEYNLFKNDMLNYQEGQPAGPAYAVCRLLSMYE
ncbi:PBSX family phage terminase large subunit [Dysgonomonas sp. GY75]|nr:PBSX family phage terminase large subunit [Dysgonomonas sp. GY75]